MTENKKSGYAAQGNGHQLLPTFKWTVDQSLIVATDFDFNAELLVGIDNKFKLIFNFFLHCAYCTAKEALY